MPDPMGRAVVTPIIITPPAADPDGPLLPRIPPQPGPSPDSRVTSTAPPLPERPSPHERDGRQPTGQPARPHPAVA